MCCTLSYMDNESFGLANDKNRSWLERAKATRNEVRDNRTIERSRVDGGMNPWPYYGRNIQSYTQRFSRFFPELATLDDVKNTLFVDLFGLASADTLGADSIGLTLDFDNVSTRESARPTQERRSVPGKPGQTVVMGNALDEHGANEFVSALKEQLQKNYKHVVVFWRPIGGAGVIETNPHASARLYALFEKVFNALPAGSSLYLDVSSLTSIQAILKTLKEIPDIQVNLQHDSNGIVCRLTKDTEAITLPHWKDIVRDPTVAQAFENVQKKPLGNRWFPYFQDNN